MNGGAGDDHLTGGLGPDAFIFSTALGPHNVDTIADFGAGDAIWLDASVFQGIGAKGQLADALFDTSIFDTGIHPLKPDALIVYNTAERRSLLRRERQSAGGLVLFATVTPGTHLDASDFFVM